MFSTPLPCNLHQMTSPSASSYSLTCVKLRGHLTQVARRFNRDCQMIGYILFYELPIIIWWQWRLCCAMSAMLGYPDFHSYGWQWRLWCTMRFFLCSSSVRVMLLKVWQDNRRDMSLQRNCVAVMLLKAPCWRAKWAYVGWKCVCRINPVWV